VSDKSDTKVYEGYFQSENNFGGVEADEDSNSQKISINF
jgi:hypothetical protein